MRTWKLLELGSGFKPTSTIDLICPHCGNDAFMPFAPMLGNSVIAAIGLGLIFDKPEHPIHQILPKKIQCRQCRRIWHDDKDYTNGSKLG